MPCTHLKKQAAPTLTMLPGISHATWAGTEDGLSQLSLWRQSMAPGAETPMHSHPCDEVVLCLSGIGEIEINGEKHRISESMSVILPRDCPHKLCSLGPDPLETLGILAASAVLTHSADGEVINLPWRS